ncbi:Txe/YoeB family addiction module toxin [Ligilactobacillus hohenheimensis]|uniref:Txe/YoeB family addiction module toxin n=1 Tax=Ligilactobacillus hohenheimensis TaxID=2991832 RepID=UPI0024BBC28C|nr:Txe/YoeB family addiction module toxin [Ligilactobacillus hohenheimensis]
MLYKIRIKNSAKGDLKKLKQSHLKSSFLDVVETLKRNPYEPSQSFEKLQPYSAGRFSRRINSQHRVVYRVDEESKIVSIYSAWTHYE